MYDSRPIYRTTQPTQCGECGVGIPVAALVLRRQGHEGRPYVCWSCSRAHEYPTGKRSDCDVCLRWAAQDTRDAKEAALARAATEPDTRTLLVAVLNAIGTLAYRLTGERLVVQTEDVDGNTYRLYVDPGVATWVPADHPETTEAA